MVGGLIVRVAGLAFTLIQVSLIARLLLPFIGSVPPVLEPYVKPLIRVTNQLIAPFAGFAEPFDLSSTKLDLPGPINDLLNPYLGRIDPVVIVAIIGGGIVGAVVMLLLRIVFRRR